METEEVRLKTILIVLMLSLQLGAQNIERVSKKDISPVDVNYEIFKSLVANLAVYSGKQEMLVESAKVPVLRLDAPACKRALIAYDKNRADIWAAIEKVENQASKLEASMRDAIKTGGTPPGKCILIEKEIFRAANLIEGGSHQPDTMMRARIIVDHDEKPH
ncbi:MAG TPA: hypothetical protein VHF05_03540, partial [Candidatus Paceibacterota bacterium]|nr:hypothetical protein [Candidatus Paceibacterota bacterium]